MKIKLTAAGDPWFYSGSEGGYGFYQGRHYCVWVQVNAYDYKLSLRIGDIDYTTVVPGKGMNNDKLKVKCEQFIKQTISQTVI